MSYYFVNDDQHVDTILRAATIEKYMCEAENWLSKSKSTVERCTQ